MFTKKKRSILILLAMVLIAVTACGGGGGDNEDASFEGQNVRVVIGSSSTTGDSYLVADGTMRTLGGLLKSDMKVDAVGAGPAFETMRGAKADGSTIMMFHDMTYLGVSFGSFPEEYSLDNYKVGPMMISNPGSCFAATAKAPYNSMVEMAEYLKANPKETVRVNIESGSVSHLGFIVFYNWVVENYGQNVADQISVIVGGSTAEKSQRLWDGNTDVIFGDYSSLLQYTEAGVEDQLAMKFIGFLDKVDGVDNLSYAEQGITVDGEPFVFAKDFVIYLPKDAPKSLLDQLDEACKKVSEDKDYIERMTGYKYKVNFKPSAEAEKYIRDKAAKMDKLIKAAPSLDTLTK